MKVIYQIVAIACLLMVTSCCTMRTTTVTQTAMPKTNDIIADLDVRSEKLTEVVTIKVKTKELVKASDLKSNAVFEALKKKQADILVAPQYKIEKEQCGGNVTYTVTVTGYPAYYTNFRQMPMAEKVELRELKEGAAYVVVNKSASNNDINYDKEVIVVPVRGGCQTLDLDGATLDRVVLKGKGGAMHIHEGEAPERASQKSKPATEQKPADKKYSLFKSTNAKNDKNIAAAESAKKAVKYSYKQCKDMEISGIVFTAAGVASLFVIHPVLVTYTSSYYDSYYKRYRTSKPYETAGMAMMGVGLGCLAIGVPLWTVGGVNKKKVRNSNYACLRPQRTSGATLSLQGGNGIGLALSF